MCKITITIMPTNKRIQSCANGKPGMEYIESDRFNGDKELTKIERC